MIGCASQNGYRAIDLLRQHHAHKSVRPGLRPERDPAVRGLENLVAQSVGAADHESQLALAAIAQIGEPFRDLARGSGRSVFVADNETGALAPGEEGGRFGLLARFAGLDFDDVDGTQT